MSKNRRAIISFSAWMIALALILKGWATVYLLSKDVEALECSINRLAHGTKEICPLRVSY
jgi:hypothetical protein